MVFDSKNAVAERRMRLPADTRREQLIAAAIRVLRSDVHGDKQINWVAAVVSEAGAAKGTFYRYFPSWESMLGVVRSRLLDDFHAPLRAALADDNPHDWLKLIVEQCERLVDDAFAYPVHHRMLFHYPLPGDSMDPEEMGTSILSRVLRAGTDAGEFHGITDCEATATLLLGGMHTVADTVLPRGERSRWVGEFARQVESIVRETPVNSAVTR